MVLSAAGAQQQGPHRLVAVGMHEFNRSRTWGDRYAAAAANETAATWRELDEGYRLAPAHAGVYMLPAPLAEAGAAGAGTLECCVRSRAATRSSAAARRPSFAAMMMHPHTAFGTVGAATAVELVRAGIRTADLAPLGVGGFGKSAYDVFVGCFGAAGTSALTAALGQRRAIASGYHKLFACCQYVHSAVEASLALSVASGRTSDDIAEIAVETHPRRLTLVELDPPTVLSARFRCRMRRRLRRHAVAAGRLRWAPRHARGSGDRTPAPRRAPGALCANRTMAEGSARPRRVASGRGEHDRRVRLPMQVDVDVLVIGAGACGLAAAIAAHDAGAGVAIVEKLDRPGGNSSLSTGSVPAAGTRFQRERCRRRHRREARSARFSRGRKGIVLRLSTTKTAKLR
jgi:hypothetical protein